MILVLKTNVSSVDAVEKLRPRLNQLLQNSRWNFDLEDCDKILRIDSLTDMTENVIALLKKRGFQCEELTDYVIS